MKSEGFFQECGAFEYIWVCRRRKRIFPKKEQHKQGCGKRNNDFRYVNVAVSSTMSKKGRQETEDRETSK